MQTSYKLLIEVAFNYDTAQCKTHGNAWIISSIYRFYNSFFSNKKAIPSCKA